MTSSQSTNKAVAKVATGNIIYFIFYKLRSMVTSMPMLETKSPCVEDAADSCARLSYIHSDKSINFSEYQASLLTTPIPEHKTEVFGSLIQGAPFIRYSRPKCLLSLAGTPAIPSFQVKSSLHLSFWKRPDQPDSK